MLFSQKERKEDEDDTYSFLCEISLYPVMLNKCSLRKQGTGPMMTCLQPNSKEKRLTHVLTTQEAFFIFQGWGTFSLKLKQIMFFLRDRVLLCSPDCGLELSEILLLQPPYC
jgi:hypothetical protein